MCNLPSLGDLCFVTALFQHAKWLAKSQVANDIEGEVVEPVQRVHLVPSSLDTVRSAIPLGLQLLQIVVDILLELQHALGGKGVSDRLPLSRVLSAIPSVEQSPPNGHKGIVVLAL